MKRIIVMLVAFILTFSVVVVQADDYPIEYRVTASVLNVRLNAGTEYDVFYKLSRGETVYGKEPIGNWTEVNCYGYKGFVWSSYITDNSKVSTEPQSGGNLTYIGNLWTTGYCWASSPNTITASGTRPVAGRTVAMSGYPFGTRVYIKGIGYRVVEDRGVGPGCIDVFYDTRSECYAITGRYEVYLVN